MIYELTDKNIALLKPPLSIAWAMVEHCLFNIVVYESVVYLLKFQLLHFNLLITLLKTMKIQWEYSTNTAQIQKDWCQLN